MATIIRSEGFEFRVASAASNSGTGAVPLFATVNNPTAVTINTTTFNDLSPGAGGSASLEVNGDGATATYATIGLANTQILTGSIYFKVVNLPAAESFMLMSTGPAIGDTPGFVLKTDGKIHAYVNSTASATGVSVNDGAWHRLDFRWKTNATTFTVDWAVDGSAQTAHTSTGETATNMTGFVMGSTAAANDIHCLFDDLVLSATEGDHPLGGHRVKSLTPNGDGTHSATLAAGDMDKSDGTDILTSTTDAYTEVDDLPPSAAHIQQTAGTSADYVEVVFPDPGQSTIWHVEGQTAYRGSTSTSCNITVRIVDSGGATVADIFSGAITTNALAYRRVTVSTNPTETAVNGYKCRIGLSTDVAPDPRCYGVILQVAYPVTDSFTTNATVTPGVIARSFVIPAATLATDVGKAAPLISRSFVIPQATPSVGGSATVTPDAIARSVTIPAATTSSGADKAAPLISRAFTIPAVTIERTATVLAPVINLAANVLSVTVDVGGAVATAFYSAIVWLFKRKKKGQ